MGRYLLTVVLTAAVVVSLLKFDQLKAMWLHPSGLSAPPSLTTDATPQGSAPNPAPATTASGPGAKSPATIPLLGSSPAPLQPLVMDAATPTPAPRMSMVVPPLRKAPPGYLYVLRHISMKTETGIFAIDPGTSLAIVSRGPVKTSLTDGENDFDVDNEYLTDETDVAELAAKKDEQSQAALASWLEGRQTEEQQTNREYAEKMEKARELVTERAFELARIAASKQVASATPASGPQVPLQGTALDRGAYDQHYSRPAWWYNRDYWGHYYYVNQYGQWIYY